MQSSGNAIAIATVTELGLLGFCFLIQLVFDFGKIGNIFFAVVTFLGEIWSMVVAVMFQKNAEQVLDSFLGGISLSSLGVSVFPFGVVSSLLILITLAFMALSLFVSLRKLSSV